MTTKQKILIVDDDANIAELISLYLMKECFETETVFNGEDAVKMFSTFHPDLILLDLMLPGLSGEDVLSGISDIPVIVISAKLDVQDKVSLLLGGAADYITKPFDIRELLARITVQLRGAGGAANASVLQWEELRLDTVSHTLTVREAPVRLTRTEYAILKQLMQYAGRVVAKSALLDQISADTPDCTENSLKIHISNLRRKLRACGGGDRIEAVWGIGFRLKK